MVPGIWTRVFVFAKQALCSIDPFPSPQLPIIKTKLLRLGETLDIWLSSTSGLSTLVSKGVLQILNVTVVSAVAQAAKIAYLEPGSDCQLHRKQDKRSCSPWAHFWSYLLGTWQASPLTYNQDDGKNDDRCSAIQQAPGGRVQLSLTQKKKKRSLVAKLYKS